MSVMAGLRAATWASHQRLEKRLDIKQRFSSLDAYRMHLEGMWGFCASLERNLSPVLLEVALPDFESRRKLPLLTQDLVALGCGATDLQLLSCCETLPDCADTESALGCAYVLEGATLGGRSLLPLVQSRLGLTAERGARFFSSYGERVTLMWRDFGSALEDWCSTPQKCARATAAAVATFDTLDQWLTRNPA